MEFYLLAVKTPMPPYVCDSIRVFFNVARRRVGTHGAFSFGRVLFQSDSCPRCSNRCKDKGRWLYRGISHMSRFGRSLLRLATAE